MIISLDYSVSFPATEHRAARTLKEAVLFQGGFGAIVGPNEAGKSMILEMIRFCLYGSAALRGKADDYKSLKAKLLFQVKGSEYLVDRTMGKATLTKDGVIIATGTTPVNKKIPQELGFGLGVFDMACVANQDELLALGAMKPTERRRAVDSVIGVSILDDLAKMAGDEATANRRAADDLLGNLREPTVPVAPDGYRPSVELSVEKEAVDLVRSRADQLRGWLANDRTRPSRPTEKYPLSSADIQVLLDQQTTRKIQRQALEAELKRIPEATGVTMDDIQADRERHKLAQAYRARRQFESLHRRPEWDQAFLDNLRQDWTQMVNQKRLEHLEQQLEDLLAKGEHTCPSCSHHWPVAGDMVTKLQIEIEEVTSLPRKKNTHALTEEKIDGYQRMLDAWNKVAGEWETVHQHAPDTLPYTKWEFGYLVELEHAVHQQARRAELIAEIEKLKPAEKEPDYATMLREQQQFEAQLAVYYDQVEAYAVWEKERGDKTIELTMLDMDLQGYPDLIRNLDQALAHERLEQLYDTQKKSFDDQMSKVTAYRAEAEDCAKVKTALQILRTKIKQYLVPSLNRVASNLISQMTGGQRQDITVDEDFNITVDGQAVDTLSGSGKAVANLALRIGLGQVLTNNVFSLFMGDEIDASMDKDRAEKTSGVLHTLKGRISQLLLVSHKSPAADYYIPVGETIDQHYDAA